MANHYKHRQKRNYTLLILALLIVLSVGGFGYYKFFMNGDSDSADVENFIDKIIKPNKDKEVLALEVGYNDYLKASAVSYDLYQKAPVVKGVYVNAPAASSTSRLDSLIELADTTEINAFVIDVKDDNGRVTFEMDIPEVDEVKAEYRYIKDIDGFMNKLYDHEIYPIARIVAFKDPYLPKRKTDYAIKNKDGSLWYYDKVPWLNPYNKDVWVYVVNIAKKAAEAGFKEIQFDYIRFEATKQLKNADFGPGSEEKTRMEIITDFVEYATSELEPYGVKVSADVFGIIINSKVDAKVIGQDYLKMAEKLDVICPMVYPSHYGKGFFGIPKDKHSDLYPYETIYGAMEDSNEEYEKLEDKKGAIVRPWLQAFTATYLRKPNYRVYDGEAIRAQIQAVYDAGLEEWILWNAGAKYKTGGLLPKE